MSKYLVRDPDNADRTYTTAVDGFDFKLQAGVLATVSAEEKELLAKASPYLGFEELKEETAEEKPQADKPESKRKKSRK